MRARHSQQEAHAMMNRRGPRTSKTAAHSQGVVFKPSLVFPVSHKPAHSISDAVPRHINQYNIHQLTSVEAVTETDPRPHTASIAVTLVPGLEPALTSRKVRIPQQGKRGANTQHLFIGYTQ